MPSKPSASAWRATARIESYERFALVSRSFATKTMSPIFTVSGQTTSCAPVRRGPLRTRLLARSEQRQGIDRLTRAQHREVEMRARRDAGQSDEADHLTCGDRVADPDRRSRERVVEMRIDGDETSGMRDDHDHRAIGEMADECDTPLRGGEHRLPQRRREIDRVVEVRVEQAVVVARRLER